MGKSEFSIDKHGTKMVLYIVLINIKEGGENMKKTIVKNNDASEYYNQFIGKEVEVIFESDDFVELAVRSEDGLNETTIWDLDEVK